MNNGRSLASWKLQLPIMCIALFARIYNEIRSFLTIVILWATGMGQVTGISFNLWIGQAQIWSARYYVGPYCLPAFVELPLTWSVLFPNSPLCRQCWWNLWTCLTSSSALVKPARYNKMYMKPASLYFTQNESPLALLIRCLRLALREIVEVP